MRHDPAGPVVVLSPHFDDAVLSAWSVLRAPGDVLVVDVCTTDPSPGVMGSWDQVTGGSDVAPDGAGFMALRRDEDVRALELAGRAATHLGFLDAQYRGLYDELAPQALGEAIATAAPRARSLHAPAGLGRHADHLTTRAAALELATRSGVPLHLYADQPYAHRMGWPHWVTQTEPRRHLRPDARWEEHMAGIDLGPREVIRLDPSEIALRARALACYETQVDGLGGGPVELLAHPAIAGWEVHWVVSPRRA